MHLRTAYDHDAAAEALIRSVWQGDADGLILASQASHAIGLAVAWLAAERGRRPRIWFPDYYCENALPLIRRQADVAFYPVTPGFEPDFDACRAMAAAAPPPDLFVLVHYFARASNGRAARAFADEAGAFLLEDAAHLLRPVGEVGRHGDFACYSPRKFFPVPDGGLLAIRGTGPAAGLARLAAGLPRFAPRAGRWLRRRFYRDMRRRLLPWRTRRRLPPTTIDADPGDAVLFDGVLMSDYARQRIGRAIGSEEIGAIASRRIAAHRRLLADLAGREGIRPVAIADGAVPYWTAVLCADEATAADALDALRREGARVATWPGLPPEVKADPGRHPGAITLRRTLLRFTHDADAD